MENDHVCMPPLVQDGTPETWTCSDCSTVWIRRGMTWATQEMWKESDKIQARIRKAIKAKEEDNNGG